MIRKLMLSTMLVCVFVLEIRAQTSTAFYINGDLDKYYPVVFSDAGWYLGKATEIEIGRSDVHSDGDWRGSLIAKFRYHTTNWGHGSHFFDADIKSSKPFVAGWRDVTSANSSNEVIIWLRGGGNSYHLNSASSIAYRVLDGIQYALPYNEVNGGSYTYKTEVESYVVNYAQMFGNSLRVGGNLLAMGYVGIGTANPQERLSVQGKIRAQEIKVESDPATWPDYVFKPGYILPSLAEIEAFIQKNGHLPGVPAADVIGKDGVALGELNRKLLEKIEELTLHMIELKKENEQIKHMLTEIKK